MAEPGEYKNQNSKSNLYPERWHKPKPETVAEPTYWPVILAAGITLLAWGVVTSYPMSVLGLGMTIVAVVNWIRDIRHEQESEDEK